MSSTTTERPHTIWLDILGAVAEGRVYSVTPDDQADIRVWFDGAHSECITAAAVPLAKMGLLSRVGLKWELTDAGWTELNRDTKLTDGAS